MSAFSGGRCGKYLADSMPLLLGGLEAHGRLTDGEARFDDVGRVELLGMSAATIDRSVKPMRQRTLMQGMSTMSPSPLLPCSIAIHKSGDEIGTIWVFRGGRC